MDKKTTNVLLSGVGGQGIILASEILAETAFNEGWKVKKSEIRGLSQLGGSVDSSVRWGNQVYSPIIPINKIDFIVTLIAEEVANYAQKVNINTHIIKGTQEEYEKLPHIKCANLYMLGKLSYYIDFKEESWQKAMKKQIKPHLIEMNLKAFFMGKEEQKHYTNNKNLLT